MRLFGFCNSPHADTVDVIGGSGYKKFARQFEKSEYLKEFARQLGVICPTTCCYRLVWKDNEKPKEITPHAYFNMEGLGLAMQLMDCTGHHFIGPAFVHSTAVAVITNETGGIKIGGKNHKFLVFVGQNRREHHGRRFHPLKMSI